MFSILHLSDLHRSEAEPISNGTLIASLLADCDRFPAETPTIRHPDAMVVSGDIVSGAPLSQEGFRDVLRKQYEVAEEFLGRLTDRLFDGDRTRVVVIPGNHDCCWNTALGGMTRVAAEEEPGDLLGELEAPESPFRWNWREQKLYRISDPDAYARRLDSYWAFIDSFYAGCALRFPIQPGTGSNLFELDRGRIVMAAFESLHGNDCFSYQGSFGPTAIADAALRIRDEGGHYNLRVAVWHHGLLCQPSFRSDYVPIDSVYELIGHGFQLGLHGHQHFAEIGSHYVHVPGDREMAVVSAGSLCAGAKDLPRGTNRQYNIVVVSDDYSEANVHVREMTRGSHFAASSGASGFPLGVARMRLSRASNGRVKGLDAEGARRSKFVLDAELHLRSGRPEVALEILEGIDVDQGEAYGRSLLIEAAEQSGEWNKLATALRDPVTADERIKLAEALTNLGRTADALTVLGDASGPPLPEHVRREMQERVERNAAVRRGQR